MVNTRKKHEASINLNVALEASKDNKIVGLLTGVYGGQPQLNQPLESGSPVEAVRSADTVPRPSFPAASPAMAAGWRILLEASPGIEHNTTPSCEDMAG